MQERKRNNKYLNTYLEGAQGHAVGNVELHFIIQLSLNLCQKDRKIQRIVNAK